MKKGWRSLILSLAAFGFAFPNVAHAQSFFRMTSAEVTQTESAGPITIGITLPPGRTRTVVVTWQFDPATSPQSDMTVTSGSINVTTGATIANIATTLLDDADASGQRLHTVTISTTDPDYPVAPDAAQTVLRITDSDLPGHPGLASDGIVGVFAPRRSGGFFAAGLFTNIMGNELPAFSALLASGRPDPTAPPVQFNPFGLPRAVRELPNGKILLAGPFATINGVPKTHLARLNANGTLDESFTLSGAPFSTAPADMDVASDESILLTGWMSGNRIPFNGETQDRTGFGVVARVAADGTRDPNFATATIGGEAIGLMALPDGKFLLYGNVRATAVPWNRNDVIPPPVREGLFRMNLDGSLDLSFQADAPLPNFPSSGTV